MSTITPPRPARPGSLLALFVLAAALAGGAWYWQRQQASPARWFEGDWTAENDGALRLSLRADRNGPSGAAVFRLTTGFLVSLPVREATANEREVLLVLEPCPGLRQTSQHYLLVRDRPGTANLYRLRNIPEAKGLLGRNKATLIPTDADKAHETVARMRKGGVDPLGAPMAPDGPKE